MRSGWRGGDMRIATSASRMPRSSSWSVNTTDTSTSANSSRNSLSRSVSQVDPNATVVVTFSGPDGRSLLSASRDSAMASL